MQQMLRKKIIPFEQRTPDAESWETRSSHFNCPRQHCRQYHPHHHHHCHHHCYYSKKTRAQRWEIGYLALHLHLAPGSFILQATNRASFTLRVIKLYLNEN